MDELATRRRGRRSGYDPILVEALASGASHQEAADRAKVSLRTVTRRVSDPAFVALIDELHARSLEGIAANLTASAAAAVETLKELLGPEQPAPVRVRAAQALLSEARQSRSASQVREGAQGAESLDVESAKQRALELVSQFGARRDMYRRMEFEASQNAGEVPPDPPPCIKDHAAGECEQCAAWQANAHAIVLEHSIDSEGYLTDAGSRGTGHRVAAAGGNHPTPQHGA